MPVAPITSGLVLRGLEYHVFLGWPAAERAVRQSVVVDISLRYAQPPAGCQSDQLADTDCYAALAVLLQQELTQQQFSLLEHLGCAIYQWLKAAVSAQTAVTIRVKKQPPISNLRDGVYFSYGDDNFPW